MSIANKLERLTTAHDEIIEKIIAKGGTVNDGDGFEEFPADIESIPTGGETYVTTLAGDGTSALNVTSIGNGVFHGHRTEEPSASSSYDIVGFYFIKQGNSVAFMVKNNYNGGAYRRQSNDTGIINVNSNAYLFTGDYAIYKVADAEY